MDMTNYTLKAERGEQVIKITRVFEAPRELLFKVLADPALIPQWWGPRRLTTRVDKMEVKAGGIWRYVQQDAEGETFSFHGVYHEILAPERMVYTFEFEGTPGHVILETVRLEEQDGRTLYVDQAVFQSVEDRDEMIAAGMEGGASESLERIAELLAKAKYPA